MSSLALRLGLPSVAPSACAEESHMPKGITFHSNGRNVVKPLGDRLAVALREAVGLGQPGGMPPKQLARDLGIDVKTVYGWLAGNGIRGEHLVRLFELMPAVFANIVLGGTGCTVVKLAEAKRRADEAARALRIARQAIEDDAELDAIEREEQHAAVATEGRRDRRHDDPARQQVVPVLAEGAGPNDGVAAPVAPRAVEMAPR